MTRKYKPRFVLQITNKKTIVTAMRRQLFFNLLIYHVETNLMVFRAHHDVERGQAYNLEVEDFHAYYVSEQSIWVHNNCDVGKLQLDKQPISHIDNVAKKAKLFNLPWNMAGIKDKAHTTYHLAYDRTI